ncbi:DUF418 domain-containing protein [Halalkalibacterium halodurans]|uniref:DUF418 domain-containing protein n=1 Tax=Halalkalibacterium halodurans TaxID=86665 RepID=UPI00106863BF|nr:DUF418 domain-containing protein [Halalkalibacterium halodurans]TES52780.1 DUF418 domain-containing protein [Halalkalibacterium halodurans]
MTTKVQVTPTLESNRIEALDMMRGFALLGILLVNMRHFQYGLFPEYTMPAPTSFLDSGADALISILAQGSFYTLFSFLFGYGMALMKDRFTEQKQGFVAVYWRRTLILLLLGYVHGLFIWDGDILFMYAICSFLLFFFLKLTERGLLIWALILLGIMATSALGELSMEEDPYTEAVFQSIAAYSEDEDAVLSSGTYGEVVEFRRTADPTGLGVLGDILIFVNNMISVIGMFLLGAFVHRKGWIANAAEHKAIFKRMLWIGLLIGFPIKIATVLSPANLETIQIIIGGPLVALFYISCIALFSQTAQGKKLLKPFTYVGRLSLTNYLLQSLVFTTVFYGYGLGLYGSLGLFVGLLLSIGFFALQIVCSHFWLRHFRIGPMEWVWRAGTYLSIPKWRR